MSRYTIRTTFCSFEKVISFLIFKIKSIAIFTMAVINVRVFQIFISFNIQSKRSSFKLATI